MKKIFILILVLTALNSKAKAQIQFSFGPGVGLNYAIHSIDTESIDNLGPLLTSQFDFQFSKRFGLLVWLDLYSDMSCKSEIWGTVIEDKISYIHLAPTLKYCIPGSRFYLFGGPGIGIKTNGDYDDMAMRFDFRFGAGHDFFLSDKITLSPFVAYNAALNNVIPDLDWKIDVLHMGIVLRFNIN